MKICHRGYIENYQENTMGAILETFDNGYLPEFDIEFTKDEQLIIFHDLTCDRMTNGSSNLNVRKSTYSQLQKIVIPKQLFGVSQFKKSSKIPLFKKVLNEIVINNNENKEIGIYMDLKGHSKSIFASKRDKLYNDKLIETLNKSASNIIKMKSCILYFASYNVGALNDFIIKWNKNNHQYQCQYLFVIYIGLGLLKIPFEYFILKTKLFYLLCPNIDAFVCDDGLFNLYFDSIIKHYKKDGLLIGFWQKYHDYNNNLFASNADIQIYNLPSKPWKIINPNRNIEKDYKHQNGYMIYLFSCFCVALSWSYTLYFCLFM